MSIFILTLLSRFSLMKLTFVVRGHDISLWPGATTFFKSQWGYSRPMTDTNHSDQSTQHFWGKKFELWRSNILYKLVCVMTLVCNSCNNLANMIKYDQNMSNCLQIIVNRSFGETCGHGKGFTHYTSRLRFSSQTK